MQSEWVHTTMNQAQNFNTFHIAQSVKGTDGTGMSVPVRPYGDGNITSMQHSLLCKGRISDEIFVGKIGKLFTKRNEKFY